MKMHIRRRKVLGCQFMRQPYQLQKGEKHGDEGMKEEEEEPMRRGRENTEGLFNREGLFHNHSSSLNQWV